MTKKATTEKCSACGRPSKYIGAMSGTCPACQNRSVAELEKSLGLKAGALGRVNALGEEVER